MTSEPLKTWKDHRQEELDRLNPTCTSETRVVNEPLTPHNQVYELIVVRKVLEVPIKNFKLKAKIDEIDEHLQSLITSHSSQH